MAWVVKSRNRFSGRFRDLDGAVKTVGYADTETEALRMAQRKEDAVMYVRRLRTRFATLRFTSE